MLKGSITERYRKHTPTLGPKHRQCALARVSIHRQSEELNSSNGVHHERAR